MEYTCTKDFLAIFKTKGKIHWNNLNPVINKGYKIYGDIVTCKLLKYQEKLTHCKIGI